MGSRTRTYVVKNSITLQDVDQKLWPPENDHTDYDGHGTMVASVAAGQRYGVASNAHLVLVKVAQTHWDTHKAEKRGMVIPKDDVIVHPQAMQTAWDWIVEDVLAKRRQGATGKAIVCMSASKLHWMLLRVRMLLILVKAWIFLHCLQCPGRLAISS